jgi:hypothetical protein
VCVHILHIVYFQQTPSTRLFCDKRRLRVCSVYNVCNSRVGSMAVQQIDCVYASELTQKCCFQQNYCANVDSWPKHDVFHLYTVTSNKFWVVHDANATNRCQKRIRTNPKTFQISALWSRTNSPTSAITVQKWRFTCIRIDQKVILYNCIMTAIFVHYTALWPRHLCTIQADQYMADILSCNHGVCDGGMCQVRDVAVLGVRIPRPCACVHLRIGIWL